MAVDFEQLANEQMDEGPTDEELKTISGLVKRQCELEDWIAEEEARLKEAKARLRKVSMELLPEAMLSAGVSEYADDNGCKVEIKQDLKASITKANQDWCFSWLRENGAGDIIRNEFKVTYGTGQDDKAKELVDALQEQGQEFNQREYIHPQTLPAFCRSELAENDHGEEWENKFGIFRFRLAKIQRP